MTSMSILPFTILYGEATSGVTEVLYELITNALDANAADDTYPNVSVVENSIVVSDSGTGITVDHLSTFGSVDERSENKHGSHGTGLKDAIAFCVRNNIDIMIETVCRTFTFRKSDTKKVVVMEQPTNRAKGTKITVPVPNATQVFDDVKSRFFFLMDPPPAEHESENPLVEMYEAPNGKGAVMMMGVKKDNSPPLDFIYNFTKPTLAQKKSIARNQAITAGCFKKHFRKAIEKANPDQEFTAALPNPPATANASVPVSARPPAPPAAHGAPVSAVSAALPPPRAIQRTVQGDVAKDLDLHCMVQDYHVWTLTSDARRATRSVATELLDFVRSLDDIKVASTSEQGSLAKNTFVPLSSDIDIVVEIVGFHQHEKLISNALRNHLRHHGCRMQDSGNHILNFSYQGVDFDLVLIDAAKVDERSARISAQSERTKAIIAPERDDSLKLQSFIRAVKYWCKRQNIAIKSCSLEMAVLAMWPQLTNPGIVHCFRHFLRGVEAELLKPSIKDYYELTAESIEEVGVKAKATLDLLM